MDKKYAQISSPKMQKNVCIWIEIQEKKKQEFL